jgi:hypothetical protein
MKKRSAAPQGVDDFYSAAVDVLQAGEVPFLVGGAYAMRQYTNVFRDTKDFDVFVRPRHLKKALRAFRKAGYHGEVAYSHWLAKVHYGEAFIDIIYRAGNGLCEVADWWFKRSERQVRLLHHTVHLVPVEAMIWQKAYIMERERFDGADVVHLLRCCAEKLDWELLVDLFGPDWRVLLNQLILFGFVYPGERHRVPAAVMEMLTEQLREEFGKAPREQKKLCRGTLVSRAQFLPDIERWGYADARLDPRAKITPAEIEAWTNAIGKERAWA